MDGVKYLTVVVVVVSVNNMVTARLFSMFVRCAFVPYKLLPLHSRLCFWLDACLVEEEKVTFSLTLPSVLILIPIVDND